jgi:hypothetical protein
MDDKEGWPYSLPVILELIKGVSARSVTNCSELPGQFGRMSRSIMLRSDESFAEKLEYMRQNPVRAGWWFVPRSIAGFGWPRPGVGRTLCPPLFDLGSCL